FLILNNHFRISYHTLNYLEPLVKRIPSDKSFSNRDWVKLLNRSFLIYDRLAFEHQNHEVMLPSDLDEALDQMLGIKRSTDEINKRRQECEEQYRAWKEGLLKDVQFRDKTRLEMKYTFYGLNGLKNCQYPDKVPEDLEKFVQNNPFREWHSEKDNSLVILQQIEPNEGFRRITPTLHTDKNASLLTKEDVEDEGMTIDVDDVDNEISFLYYGPKYVLDMDQDFYLCEIPIPFRNNDKGRREYYYTKNYSLHFNPVKNYLTLYPEPMNKHLK
ncbi:MAG: hypothetical protein Q8885_02770, partial [Candidatus Phytoplasma stylosanthis]|nr:hypothetical protein [Candidatus Phytoplasma stylosanthis]